jgi:hypothetical protein
VITVFAAPARRANVLPLVSNPARNVSTTIGFTRLCKFMGNRLPDLLQLQIRV